MFRRAERRGSAADGLIDVLLEQAGLGLCLVSPRGKVLRANAEWLRLTGHLADESLGRDVAELLPLGSRALRRPLGSAPPR